LNPPLSLELLPPPDHERPLPPLIQPPPPPRPPGDGAVMAPLNIVKTDATMPASAERISDPKTNHTKSPIRPPLASEPNSGPNKRRKAPPSSRTKVTRTRVN